MQVSGNRRFASYTNLPPGDYTLQVKYTPDRENEGENVTELKITIVPYFYKTVWFILLIIILVLVSVWQFYQWRIRTLKRQKEYLHRTVEERTHGTGAAEASAGESDGRTFTPEPDADPAE